MAAEIIQELWFGWILQDYKTNKDVSIIKKGLEHIV